MQPLSCSVSISNAPSKRIFNRFPIFGILQEVCPAAVSSRITTADKGSANPKGGEEQFKCVDAQVVQQCPLLAVSWLEQLPIATKKRSPGVVCDQGRPVLVPPASLVVNATL